MGLNKKISLLKTLFWLSHQIEANWTKFFIYLIYITVRPTFTLLLMIFIYIAVSAVRGPDLEYGYFILVGQAFYNLVGSGIIGIAYTFFDDKEHYKMLKYIYISNIKLSYYLFGRASYHFIEGIYPLIIAFILGAYIIQYPIFELKPNLPLLFINIILGFIWITAFGFLVASFLLFTTNYGWVVIDSIVASLLLFGGVLYPTDILPYPLNIVAYYLPIKYWLDINRAVIKGIDIIYIFNDLIFILTLSIIYLFISLLIFKISENIAKKKGLLDISVSF
jgi:ABC-2 type transport system permease protein